MITEDQRQQLIADITSTRHTHKLSPSAKRQMMACICLNVRRDIIAEIFDVSLNTVNLMGNRKNNLYRDVKDEVADLGDRDFASMNLTMEILTRVRSMQSNPRPRPLPPRPQKVADKISMVITDQPQEINGKGYFSILHVKDDPALEDAWYVYDEFADGTGVSKHKREPFTYETYADAYKRCYHGDWGYSLEIKRSAAALDKGEPLPYPHVTAEKVAKWRLDK